MKNTLLIPEGKFNIVVIIIKTTALLIIIIIIIVIVIIITIKGLLKVITGSLH